MNMENIKITFPDGSIKEFKKNITLADISGSISTSLRKKSIAGYVNDTLYDINREIINDSKIKIITKDDEEAWEILNHSSAHLLAHAIKRLYPKALFWVGPVISEGFYYDIDLGDESLKETDLIKIEKEMKKIIKENISLERIVLTKNEALELFKNDRYKVDLIKELDESETITA